VAIHEPDEACSLEHQKKDDSMNHHFRPRALGAVGWIATALLAGAACGGSTESSSGQQPASDGGTTSGSGGSSSTTTTGSGGSAGSSSTSGAGGGSSDGGLAACESNLKSALVKDCQTETDCALLNHNDCCGTIVIAVKKGTEAGFTAAEAAYQSCVPNCLGRGCFHADMSEDHNQVGMVGQSIVAVCVNKLCMSTVK
jgi:hypothetical protein